MPKYVIERKIPGAGKLTADELQAISQSSCAVIESMQRDIEWIQSYVTDDKVYCVYDAVDKDAIREHAEKGNFPANSIEEIHSVISPATAKKTD